MLKLTKFNEISKKFEANYFVLPELNSSKLKVLLDEDNLINYPDMQLDDFNKSINLDFNLASVLATQYKLYGSITSDPTIDSLKFAVLDAETNVVIGQFDATNLDSYLLNLNKFAEENSSLNILGELFITRNGVQEIYIYNGEKLIPNDTVLMIKKNDTWVIDTNQTGYITLTSPATNFDLDIAGLLNSFNSETFKINLNIDLGNFILDENHTVTFELINLKNGKPEDFLSVDKKIVDNNLTMSTTFFDEGKYILAFFVTEKNIDGTFKDNSFVYNPETSQILDMSLLDYVKSENGFGWIPDTSKAGFVDFNSDNKEYSFQFAPFELLNQVTKLSGQITNLPENENHILVYNEYGDLLGEGEIDENGSYAIDLPLAENGENLILKIGDYFVGANNSLIEADSVVQDENGTFVFDSTFTPISFNPDNEENINFATAFEVLESNKFVLYGNIIGLNPDENMTIQLVDFANKKYLPRFDVKENNYSIELPNGGDFIMYIALGNKELFYDFNTSSFKSLDNVEIYNFNGFWSPKPEEVGYINFDTSKKVQKVDINLSKLTNAFIDLSGTIILPPEFFVTEQCLINGELFEGLDCDPTLSGFEEIKKTDVALSIIDTAQNKEVAFIPIDSEAIAVGNNIQYSWNTSIENVDNLPHNLIFKLLVHKFDQSSKQYFEIFYDIQNDEVINAKLLKDKIITPLVTSSSQSDILLDYSDFFTSQNVLKVNLDTLPTDFNFAENGYSAHLNIFDFDTAKFVDSITLKSNVSPDIYLGNTVGNYLFELELNYPDHIQNLYLDFDSNHTADSVQVKSADEVKFVERFGEYIPNITYLTVDGNVTLSLNINTQTGYQFSGSLSSNVEIQNVSIFLKDYQQDIEYFSYLEKGAFNLKNIKEGNYTVTLFVETSDNKFFTVYLTDSGFAFGKDVEWRRAINNDGRKYFYPYGVKQVSINSDLTNFDINLGDFLLGTQTYDINLKVESDKVNYLQFFIPNKATYKYISCLNGNSACQIDENSTSLLLKDVEPKSGYFLALNIDNKEYYYNPTENSLVSGVTWSAFNSEDIKVCPTEDNDWNCDWNESYNWTWRPDTESFDLSNLNSDLNLTIQMPEEPKLT